MTVASTRVTHLFTLLGGAEVANVGHSAFPIGTPTQAECESLADTARSAWTQTMWTAPAHDLFPDTTLYLGARVAVFDVNNQLVASGESLLATPLAGGSTSRSLPPQISVVCSLRTVAPGARGRGRMYLPPFHTPSVSATGRLEVADAQSAAAGMEAYFNLFNLDTLTDGAAVASQAGSSVSRINAIRVGTVFDTQRRRRDDLNEAYFTEPVL